MERHSTLSILNVGQDGPVRTARSVALRRAGHRVVEVRNGLDALRWAREQPDLIVLDETLPDLSGTEVCTRLRSTPETASIALTLILPPDSSGAMPERRIADRYLTYEDSLPSLIEAVGSLIEACVATRARRTAIQQWDSTYDALIDVIFQTDEGCRVQRCNSAATELLNVRVEEINGRYLNDLLGDIDAPYLCNDVQLRKQIRVGRRYFDVDSTPTTGLDGNAGNILHVLQEVPTPRSKV